MQLTRAQITASFLALFIIAGGHPAKANAASKQESMKLRLKSRLQLLTELQKQAGGNAIAAGQWIKLAQDAQKADVSDVLEKSLGSAEKAELSYHQKIQIAMLYSSTGLHKDALRLFGSLVKDRPGEAYLYLDLAQAAVHAKERSQALKALRAAGKLKPDFKQRHRMALIYQDLGKHNKAVNLLRELAKQRPIMAIVHKDLGVSLYLNKKPDLAIKHLKTALEIDPSFYTASLSLASVLLDKGLRTQALAVYDKALAAGGDNAEGLKQIRQARQVLSKNQ